LFKKNHPILNIAIAQSALVSFVLVIVVGFFFASLPIVAKEFQLQEIAEIGQGDTKNTNWVELVANPSDKTQYFAADRDGRVNTLNKGKSLDKTLIDLTQAFPQAQGIQLTAFTLHPNFSIRDQQGHATFYTAHSELFNAKFKALRLKTRIEKPTYSHEAVVTEWQFNSSSGIASNLEKKREILRIPLLSQEGMIKQLAFDPFQKQWSDDFGLLYIALNGTNEASKSPLYSGTVLRINPVKLGTRGYSIPADNPFLKDSKVPNETYLLGLQQIEQLLWSKQNNQALFINHLYNKQRVLSKGLSGNDWRQQPPHKIIADFKQDSIYPSPFVVYQGRSYKNLIDKALFFSFEAQKLKLNSVNLAASPKTSVKTEGVVITNTSKTLSKLSLHQDIDGELLFSDNTGSLYYLESALTNGPEQGQPESENIQPEPSQTGSYLLLFIIALGVILIILRQYRGRIQLKITRSTLHKRYARFEYDEESQSIHLFKRHQEEIDNTLRLTDIVQSEILLNGNSISIISAEQGQGFNSSLETKHNRIFAQEHRDKMVDDKVRQIDLILTDKNQHKYNICTYLRKGNQRLTKAGYHETVEKLIDWCWLIAQQLNASETGKRIIRVKPVIQKQTHTSYASSAPESKEETQISVADQKMNACSADKKPNTEAKTDTKASAETKPVAGLKTAAKQSESSVDAELVNALDKLGKLKQQGFLSEEEFASAKAKLLQDLLK